MSARLTGDIFGDCGLYAGDGQSEGERQHGGDQLIDTHALRTEHIGQKDTVEKADKAAQESRQRQDDSTGYERVFPFFPIHRAPSC